MRWFIIFTWLDRDVVYSLQVSDKGTRIRIMREKVPQCDYDIAYLISRAYYEAAR